MNKLLLISFILIFASSTSATVYKWADEGGMMNFTDDYGKIPPDYRNKAKEVSMPKTARSAPSKPLLETSQSVHSPGRGQLSHPPLPRL